MRKGFALNEFLFMFPVMIVILFMCVKPIRTILADMPQMQRDLQSNVSVQHMLRGLRSDIESAMSVPRSFVSKTAQDNILLIESSVGVICYELIDGEVIKSMIPSQLNDPSQKIDSWPVPNASINWKTWRHNDDGYAVEVTHSIDRMAGGRWHKKLKNSHVFFISASGGSQEGL